MAVIAAADAALATERAHLTTAAAGEIARHAGVGHVEPFHFSPRYAGEEDRMLADVAAAFAGEPQPARRAIRVLRSRHPALCDIYINEGA